MMAKPSTSCWSDSSQVSTFASSPLIFGFQSFSLYFCSTFTCPLPHRKPTQPPLPSLGPPTSLQAGAYFGEASLLTDSPCNSTVRALSRVQLLTLSKKDFERLLGYKPHRTLKSWEVQG